jgi:hypothetical protein
MSLSLFTPRGLRHAYSYRPPRATNIQYNICYEYTASCRCIHNIVVLLLCCLNTVMSRYCTLALSVNALLVSQTYSLTLCEQIRDHSRRNRRTYLHILPEDVRQPSDYAYSIQAEGES